MKNNNKNISDLNKMQNLKKDAVFQSIHVFFFFFFFFFFTYRSYLTVTEKSNIYDVSFPQASISKNNSVSLYQLKGLLPWQQVKNQGPIGMHHFAFLLPMTFAVHCRTFFCCPRPGEMRLGSSSFTTNPLKFNFSYMYTF